MDKLTILGHKNQDTDSTCAALALENLLKKTGAYGTNTFKVQAKIADAPNRETKYVLERFKVKAPAKFRLAGGKKKEAVILVDFNEEEQSPIPFKKAELEGLVDHHKLKINVDKEYPILFRVEPIGSSSSLVYKLFKDQGIIPEKAIASLLLAGIVSDTLNFSSPTTTEEDKQLAKELAQITKINTGELSGKMFEAKSDLKGIRPADIITTDYKEFKFGKKKTGIGVLETVDPQSALGIEREIRKALSELKKKHKLDLIFFGLVDILKNSTDLILIGQEEEDAARLAFGKSVSNGFMKLPGVVSRKKQMVPEFTKKIK